MKTLRAFIRNQSGGPAAEFALVLPLVVLFLLGTIDVGRFMWEYNRAEKATQMGARYAVVTDAIASGLKNYSFALSCGVPQGSAITSAQFGGISCVGGGTVATPTAICSVSSTCSPAPPATADGTRLKGLVDRMRFFKEDIVPANVSVNYAYSGLGYAGDPNGLDVAPLTTVRVTGLQFTPITLFNAVAINMPDFSYSLTMEDGSGLTTPN